MANRNFLAPLSRNIVVPLFLVIVLAVTTVILSQKLTTEKFDLEKEAAVLQVCTPPFCPAGVQGWMIPGIYVDEASCEEAEEYVKQMDARRIGAEGLSLAKECAKVENTGKMKKICEWLKLSNCNVPYLYVLMSPGKITPAANCLGEGKSTLLTSGKPVPQCCPGLTLCKSGNQFMTVAVCKKSCN